MSGCFFMLFAVVLSEAVHSLHAAADAFLHPDVAFDVSVKIPGRSFVRRVAEADFANYRAAL